MGFGGYSKCLVFLAMSIDLGMAKRGETGKIAFSKSASSAINQQG